MSEGAANILREIGGYTLEYRGLIELKVNFDSQKATLNLFIGQF